MGSRTAVPVYDENLFAPAALRAPFEHYRAIRDMAPVVRLRDPDVLVLSRHADVRAALRAADVLVSGRGIGFNPVVNAPRENPSTINSDGERHRRLRRTLNRFLMPMPIAQWRGVFRGLMDARLAELREAGGWFDAMTAIAGHLPVQAVSHLAGLPDSARAKMLRWASASFNTFGVPGAGEQRRQFDADLATRAEVQDFLRTIVAADLKPGSWGEALFQAAADGRLDIGEARAALAAFVLPSLDTTILAGGNLLYDLAQHPGEWDRLRRDPALVTSAVLESLRHLPVVRWFSRVCVGGYHAGEVRIPAGSRVMLLYGAANRDGRHYPAPDRFDVARAPTDQLGWGSGPHMCAGMHLARMEMEVLLEAMAGQVERLEAGDAEPSGNQGLFGFTRLPMWLHWAAR